jgi:hypothetical protein
MSHSNVDKIEQYLQLTGQSHRELLAGAATYGPGYILDELVPKALAEKKKIVWVNDLIEGEDVGMVHWELRDI